jgi:hypothetical protein
MPSRPPSARSRESVEVEQIPTPLNRSLAEALSNRMSAELSAVSGRAAFWRAVGIGVICFGIGAAIGIGLFGYSFVTRASGQMETLSLALQKTLSTVELHGTADGKVDVTSPELTLAKGATVSFDSSSRLLLDPAAKVVADGEIRVQAPAISTPRTPTPRSPVQTKTIANFTVFKSVPFAQGDVLTGWIFLTSAQESPTQQYCYYNENAENSDLAIRIELATDGVPESNKTNPKAFDTVAALAKCVWFRKESP